MSKHRKFAKIAQELLLDHPEEADLIMRALCNRMAALESRAEKQPNAPNAERWRDGAAAIDAILVGFDEAVGALDKKYLDPKCAALAVLND